MGHRWLSRMMYAQRSRHGVWKYRRAIPQALRAAADGRREIVATLRTKSETGAQQAYLAAHGKAEAYLQRLARMVANPAANSDRDIRELGMDFLRQIRMPYVALADLKSEADNAGSKGPSEYEQRLGYVEDHLGIDVADPDERDQEIAGSWKARAVLGTLPVQQLMVSDALKIYLDHKAPHLAAMSTGKAGRFKRLIEGIIRSLQQAMGGDRPLALIARRDVRAFRDALLARPLAASTVNKYVKMAGTVWTVAARETELTNSNPFAGHAISNEVHARDRREVLTGEEVAALLQRRPRMKAELSTILILLTYTGARLGLLPVPSTGT